MRSIKIILLFCITLNFVRCQNSTDYNSQRFGFGSVDGPEGSSTPSTNVSVEYDYYSTDEGTTTVDSSGGGLVIAVDNVTIPNSYTTVSPRQIPYVPVSQPAQQQFIQDGRMQQGKDKI